jgi:cytoplasmic tRNA 2-thiolation protein 2
LLHTAASRQASHLVLGTSLTALSVNLISGIAQGAGFAVSEEAREEWSPRPEQGIKVRVVRPMKDIGMKECAIWDWWHGLRVVGGSIKVHDRGQNAIGALTRGRLIVFL